MKAQGAALGHEDRYAAVALKGRHKRHDLCRPFRAHRVRGPKTQAVGLGYHMFGLQPKESSNEQAQSPALQRADTILRVFSSGSTALEE